MDTHSAFLGKKSVRTAASAIKIVESAISEGLASVPEGITENIFGRPLIENSEQGLAFAMGLSSAGLRASASLFGKEVLREEEQLTESVRRHLGYVAHIFTQNADRGDHEQNSDHRFFHAASNSGWIQLFASNVQEAVDLTIMAHRMAELSLTPVMIAMEFAQTSAENVIFPDQDILAKFLGNPDDFIDCPTPAQKMIFGKSRRRIPNWFHFDFPTIHGIEKTGSALSYELAAQQAYFSASAEAMVQQVFSEYKALTGRNYSSIESFQTEDAEYVILTQGSSFNSTAAIVESLRSKKIKAGAISLRVARPFPGKEMCELLSGKKGVTVLERVAQPLASDPPIFRDVASVLDKATRNAFNKKKPAYPEFPVMSERQRPTLFSGQYGIGDASLSHGKIHQVFENMSGEGRRRFFVDIDFSRKSSLFPKQQILLQNLKRDYPELEQQSLHGSHVSGIDADKTFSIRWRVEEIPDDFMEFFSGLIAERWNARVKTKIYHGRDSKATDGQIHFTRETWPYPIETDDNANLLITNASALYSLAILFGLKEKAHIVVIAPPNEPLYLPKFVATRMEQMKFKLFLLPRIADTAEMVIGAAVSQIALLLEDSKNEIAFIEKFCKDTLDRTLSESQKTAVFHGLTSVKEITDISTIPTEEPMQAELPLALRKYEDRGPPYSRIAQFYDRTGLFYETGNTKEIVADPFQSIPVVPAASANFNNAGLSRRQFPEFIASKCSGCGQCSVYCPDMAIPSIVISAESLIRSAVERVQSNGVGMTQMTPPVITNLAKLANQMVSASNNKMSTLGEILPDAFERLSSQMKLEGERLSELTGQFNTLMPLLSTFPASATKTFFAIPDSQSKGSGSFFSLAVNPQACTGCGICEEVCPEEALVMTPESPESDQQLQFRFKLWELLPDTPTDIIQRMNQDKTYDPFAAILLSRNYYKTIAGGLSTERGTSERIMAHLLTATTESVVQSNTVKQLKDMDQRIVALSEKIQNKLREALPTGNFDNLLTSLSGNESERISLDSIIGKLSATQRFGVVETAWMERIVTLINDLKQLSWILSKGPTGAGRSRFGAVLSSGEAMSWAKKYPYNAFVSPVVIFDNPSSMDFLSGLCRGHIRQMMDNIKLLRRADLEIQNLYDPHIHDRTIANLNWSNLTESEKAFIPPVLVIADPQSISEAQLPALFRILSSELPIKIFVFDSASGKAEYWLSRMALTTAVLTLRKTFFLQSSLAKPEHLYKGLVDGLRQPNPAFFHVLTPEIPRNNRTQDIQELFRLALESRAFPLIRFVESSKKTFFSEAIDLSANPNAFENFISSDESEMTATFADWAFSQAKFKDQFLRMEDKNPQGIAIGKYCELSHESRKGKIPFVKKESEKFKVSEVIVKATDAANASWKTLREMAGMLSPYPQKIKERIDEEWTLKHESALNKLKSEYDEKIESQEAAQLEVIKQKLSDKLLALSGYGQKTKSPQ